jgi:hypothetical protein
LETVWNPDNRSEAISKPAAGVCLLWGYACGDRLEDIATGSSTLLVRLCMPGMTLFTCLQPGPLNYTEGGCFDSDEYSITLVCKNMQPRTRFFAVVYINLRASMVQQVRSITQGRKAGKCGFGEPVELLLRRRAADNAALQAFPGYCACCSECFN